MQRLGNLLHSVAQRISSTWRRAHGKCVVRHLRRGMRLEMFEHRQLLAVVISEFVASNQAWIEDGDGNSSDWIEIHNAGQDAVDLAGYRLTDSFDDLKKRWSLPQVILQPDEYLVVFVSGQESADYVDAQGNVHANFSLKRGGEYLPLVDPGGTIVSEFGAAGRDYPEQLPNVSYGVAQSLTLVDSSSESALRVPVNDRLGRDWTHAGCSSHFR